MANYNNKIIFIGIDVHLNTYSVTVVYEGVMIKQDTFEAKPKVLLKYLQRAFQGAKIKSGYEAGFCGFGLHRFLVENGIENIVIHPASIEVEGNNRKKTDKRDSKKIAIQLAAGRLQSVYIPSKEQENRRYICRLRNQLVKERVRTAVRLKSFLNVNSLEWQKGTFSKKNIGKLLNLNIDENLKFYIKMMVETWLYFAQGVAKVDKELSILTPEEQSLYEIYRKVIGIGPKTACILLHELGDTMQFSNEEKLFSFCGFTPSEHSSGDRIRLGHITRQGRPILRKVLVQAAWVATRKDPYLKEYFEKLSTRRGRCRAIIAVARKLLARIRSAIKKKELYLAVKAVT